MSKALVLAGFGALVGGLTAIGALSYAFTHRRKLELI